MMVEILQNCGEKEPSCSLQPLVSSLIPCTQSSICLWTSSPMQKRLACFSKVFATRNKYNPSVINFASQEEKPSVSFLILITQSSICLWTSSPRNPSTCFEKKVRQKDSFYPFTNNLSFLFSIPNSLHLGKASMEKNVFFRALPELPKPPPQDPNSGNLVLFFRKLKFKI